MTQRILITGASGFIGSAIARTFLGHGYTVRVLVRPQSDLTNIQGLPVERVTGDLQQFDSFAAALDGCDGLIHAAADYRFFVPNPEYMQRINVEATLRLIKTAARMGVKRMVYTSSVATLGHRLDGAPADETCEAHIEEMIGHYKRSKFLAEQALRRLITEAGLNVVIVNPAAPVGPRDIKPTPTGRMVFDAASGHMPAYVDTGLNIVHVDDVANGHVLAYEHGLVGERYILGGDNLSLAEILSLIARLSGRKPPRFRLAPGLLFPVAWLAEQWARLTGKTPLLTRDELQMARHYMFFSSAKAERELGYSHRPAEQAFMDALQWAGELGRLGTAFRLHDISLPAHWGDKRHERN